MKKIIYFITSLFFTQYSMAGMRIDGSINPIIPGSSFSVGTSTFVVTEGNIGVGLSPSYQLDILGRSNFPIRTIGAAGGGFIMGSYDSTWGGLWPSGITPSMTNYALLANPTYGIALNVPTNGSIQFLVNDGTIGQLTSTTLALNTSITSATLGVGKTFPVTKVHISSGTITLDGTGAPTTGGALCLNSVGAMSKCTTAIDASGNCTCP